MKTRQSLVSNSSTTSFCIYGTRGISRWAENADGEEIDLFEELCEAGNPDGLEWHTPDDGNHYIGASWASIGDDETGKQFKARVDAALNKIMDKAGHEGPRTFTTYAMEYYS